MFESLETRRMLAISVGAPVGGILTINGSEAADNIQLSVSGANLVVKDVIANLSNNVALAGITGIVINLKGGSDVTQSDNTLLKPITVNGGAGNDTLRGSGLADQINGNEGDDVLFGGLGGDALNGGAGNDTADYSARATGVNVSIGAGANDGEAGENDNVGADVETVIGSNGNDTLTGNAEKNLLVGNGGSDQLLGGDNDDTLDGGLGSDNLVGGNGLDVARYTSRTENMVITLDGAINDGAFNEFDNVGCEAVKGGSGNDSITGSAGNDYLDGGDGKDTIHGAPGNDTIIGSTKEDQLYGDAGADFIFAQDGTIDYANGGADTDAAQVDANDIQASFADGVMSVMRPTPAGATTTMFSGPTAMALQNMIMQPSYDIGFTDPSFGAGNGFATFNPGQNQTFYDMALTNTGRIVAVGGVTIDGYRHFLITRTMANGSPDLSFGNDGSIAIDVGGQGNFSEARGVALDNDGNIVVVGEANIDGSKQFAVLRMTANGSFDSVFGGDGPGATYIDFGGDASANSVAIDQDQNIIVVGTGHGDGVPFWAVARLNFFGQLDDSFDGDGQLDFTIGAGDDAKSVQIVDGDEIVIGGTANDEFTVVRLNSDGTFDEEFGNDGIGTASFGEGHPAKLAAIAIAGDGGIVAVGSADMGETNLDVAVAKFTNNGNNDFSFGGQIAGTHTDDVFNGHSDNAGTDVAIRDDGMIFVSIWSEGSQGGVGDGHLGNGFTQLNQDGFTQGTTTTHFTETQSQAWAVVSQKNKVLTAGDVGASAALTRFIPYGPAAQPGELDHYFGDGNGITKQTMSQIDRVAATATLPDGKILVASTAGDGYGSDDIALTRYNIDGSIDDDQVFGFAPDRSGGVIMDFFEEDNEVYNMIVDDLGRILVVGSTGSGYGNDFLIARFNSDGTLDDSFNESGFATASFGGFESANDLAILPDGRIVVVGSTNTNGSQDFAIAMFNDNGTLDTNFGNDIDLPGRVIFDFADGGGSFDIATAVAIDAANRIVVGGYSGVNNVDSGIDIALARFDTFGNLDGSFDNPIDQAGPGTVLTEVGNDGPSGYSDDFLNDLIILPNGKIMIAGYSQPADIETMIAAAAPIEPNAVTPSTDFVTARYDVNGVLDPTWHDPNAPSSVNGTVLTDFGTFESEFPSFDTANSMVRQSNGKIVVVGRADSGESSDFAVATYNVDGTLDTNFFNRSDPDHAPGTVVTPIDGFDFAVDVALQNDGSIVVAGNTNGNIAIAQYVGDYLRPAPGVGQLNPDFGEEGQAQIDLGSFQDHAAAAVMQPDGKVLVVGTVDIGDGFSDFGVARFNADGTVDSNFGNGYGYVLVDIGDHDQASSIALDLEGGIIVAGSTGNGYGGAGDFALARLLGNGELDNNFESGFGPDHSGTVTLDFNNSDDVINDVVIEPISGRIIVVGSSNAEGSVDFAIAAFDANGNEVTNFGDHEFRDAALDFSNDGTNPNGSWHYGYFDTLDDGIIGYTDPVDDSLERWTDPTNDSFVAHNGTGESVETTFGAFGPGQLGLHSGADGKYVTVRYIVPKSGTYNIHAIFGGLINDGTVADVHVLHNGGTEIFSDEVNGVGEGPAFQQILQLEAGDTIDFVAHSDDPISDVSLDAQVVRMSGHRVLDLDGNNTAGDEAFAVAIDGDGKIVVGGTSGMSDIANDFALARFYSDGVLDTTFDDPSDIAQPGVVITDIGNGGTQSHDQINDLVIQDDQRIVVVGYSSWFDQQGGPPREQLGEEGANFVFKQDVALARYNPDGTLDTSFHDDDAPASTLGTVVTDFQTVSGSETYEFASSIAIREDGKYVVAGGISEEGAPADFAVARYNIDGSLDTTFFDETGRSTLPGTVITDFHGGSDNGVEVLIDIDGNAIVAGTVDGTGAGNMNFGLAKYTNGANPIPPATDGVVDIEDFTLPPEQLDDIIGELGGSPELYAVLLTRLEADPRLFVLGTTGDDVIRIFRDGAFIKVNINGGEAMYDANLVTDIDVDARGGNDTVTIEDNVGLPATLHGGLGNDTFFVKNGAAEVIEGDEGDDSAQTDDSATDSSENVEHFLNSEIQGSLFDDIDGDGVHEASDTEYNSGTLMFLDLNGDRILQDNEPWVYTDEQSNYAIDGLADGNYNVRIEKPAGWRKTAPVNPGFYTVTVPTGQDATVFPGRDFGLSKTVRVFGTVYNDLNANSFKDVGEPGVAGVVLFDDQNQNEVLDDGEFSVTTDADGKYTAILEPGQHFGVVMAPAGYTVEQPVGGKIAGALPEGSTFPFSPALVQTPAPSPVVAKASPKVAPVTRDDASVLSGSFAGLNFFSDAVV